MSTAIAGGELWITRIASDGNDREVARIGYGGEGAAAVFTHARRVIGPEGESRDLVRGDLIVTLLDANGDSTDEDPLRVPARMAGWFLDSWLRVPKSWRAR